nr:MAG TPA: hypothetical protein [Caudoviricetes sp.]
MSADGESTMVIVGRASLEGMLRASLPHTAKKLPDGADDGAGLLRLAVVRDCLMGLTVSVDRERALAVRFTVYDQDVVDADVVSVWLRRAAVESLVFFLAGSPVSRVSVVIAPDSGVTVKETGVLYGAQMVHVAPAAEPTSEDRCDAARLILGAAGTRMYQDARIELDPATVRVWAATARAWNMPLKVRHGAGEGRSAYLWGIDSCLGWSHGSVLWEGPTTSEPLYHGASIPYLEEAVLPPVPVGVAQRADMRYYSGGEDL